MTLNTGLAVVIVLVILWYLYTDSMDQPIAPPPPKPLPTIRTEPVYTVVNTATGALTVPGKISVPSVPIYSAKNYWQLYLQRGSSTLPGQKHPMYMRGDANRWQVWKNTYRHGISQDEYKGNMRWG
tara:strand:- start:18394 stop:18771 length:378 start_codon:yes stop_codon:yes gene_type:complete